MFAIPPPQDWKEFENLCKDLWAAILNDNDIQLHGRSGQEQQGVDIFGINRIDGRKYGIQCKQKTYPKNLSIDEIETEVRKAEKFSPKLDVYILATTAPKDQKIEAYAREISERNNNKGKFSVYVYGWGDIEAKLNDHANILKKYYSKFLDPKNQNGAYFNFWHKENKINKLFYYACFLPFSTFNIRYSYVHLNMLSGYLNKHDDFLLHTRTNAIDNRLKEAMVLFNDQAHSLIGLISEYPPRYETSSSASDIVYTYWVECSHLDYVEQGEFIERKKGRVRECFYKLIQTSNKIISIWNTQLNEAPQISLTSFSQPNPNFPLFGDMLLIEEHYPMSEN